MPEGNDLVAPRQDSTEWYSGIGLAESAVDTYNGVQNQSWLEGGLGIAGTGLETLSLALDPVGTLLQYGVSWLMEHVKPLSDALDWLAGDGDQIAAYARTWMNVSKETADVAADLATDLTNGTSGWTGEAADAYREFGRNQQATLAAAATGASTIGTVVQVVGMLVGAVREIVRDLVAECVATLIARIPQWVAEIGGTFGAATPHVVASASALVAKWVARISDFLLKLTRSLQNLQPIMRNLTDIFGAIKNGLRRTPNTTPNTPSTPDAVHLPTTDAPTTNAPTTNPPTTNGPTTTPSAADAPTPSNAAPSSPAAGTTTPASADAPPPANPAATSPSADPTSAPYVRDGQGGGWSGARYVDETNSTPAAREAYDRIRNRTDDAGNIAENTGLDPRMVEGARNNLFVNQHEVPVGPDDVRHGYFTPDDRIADLWERAAEGPLSPADRAEIRALVAHEYVEGALMDAGLPYRSSHPDAWDDGTNRATAEHFGAHDIAPNSNRNASLSHWERYGIEIPDIPLADDLSNLDDIVAAAKRGLGL